MNLCRVEWNSAIRLNAMDCVRKIYNRAMAWKLALFSTGVFCTRPALGLQCRLGA